MQINNDVVEEDRMANPKSAMIQDASEISRWMGLF
jgi:hypothetical protein